MTGRASSSFRASLLVLACSAPLSGCWRTYAAMGGPDVGPKGAHYVLVERQGKQEWAYDCYSRPEGEDWDPRCREIVFERHRGPHRGRPTRVEGDTDTGAPSDVPAAVPAAPAVPAPAPGGIDLDAP